MEHKALYSDIKKNTIQSFFVPLINSTSNQEDSNDIEVPIRMDREELTILILYILDHDGIKRSKTDIIKILHAITNTKYNNYQNSHFTEFLKTHINKTYEQNTNITKLKIVKKRLRNVKLDYIARGIQATLEKNRNKQP